LIGIAVIVLFTVTVLGVCYCRGRGKNSTANPRTASLEDDDTSVKKQRTKEDLLGPQVDVVDDEDEPLNTGMQRQTRFTALTDDTR